MEKKVRLYNVYYNYDNSMTYETTTDNFDKWLDQHNKERVADGSMPENKDEFEVKEASIALFGGKDEV